MNSVLKGYLRLARPANLPTAAADILAGVAISGVFITMPGGYFWTSTVFYHILLLVGSSVFLYAGGVILNDVFDAKLDAVERPERPIPSGLIPIRSAALYGSVMLLLGVILAILVHILCGAIAVLLMGTIVLYDGYSKKYSVLGPINMGLCRGLNLLLGMGVLGVLTHWWCAVIPIIYIAAITLISRGEVHGDNKKHIVFSGILYIIVILLISVLMYINSLNIIQTIPFLFLFSFLIFRPLIHAYKENSPTNIKKAVMAGVLSLVVMDAAVAVCFSQWWLGLAILLLLPVSIYLSKLFSVT